MRGNAEEFDTDWCRPSGDRIGMAVAVKAADRKASRRYRDQQAQSESLFSDHHHDSHKPADLDSAPDLSQVIPCGGRRRPAPQPNGQARRHWSSRLLEDVEHLKETGFSSPQGSQPLAGG